LAAVAVACVLECLPRDASALGPVDLELGAKAGGGTSPSGTGAGAPNPLGFGLGGRGGVSFFGVYAGVNVMYYLGGSQSVTIVPGSTLSVSAHSLLYGAELGYNIKVAILTIRPQVGLGNYTLSTTGFSDVNNLYVQPGLTGLISLGMYYIGADASVLILPGIESGGGTSTAFTVGGQFGVKF
jgi:hypothetical protein